MYAHSTQAPLRRPAMSGHAADRRLTRQLRRFAHRQRGAVIAMADRHPRLADLAFSFPALLFALSVRRAGFPAPAVIEAVIRGESLKQAAQLAGLPLWLRKLPPESFNGPIPKLPDGEVFRRRICNALPKRKQVLELWLNTVSFTAYWGGEDFAVWAAAQVAKPSSEARNDWGKLALWAWYSMRPALPACGLIATPWTPAITLDKAVDAAEAWVNAINEQLTGPAARPMVLPPGPREVDGYLFCPVLGREEIASEAEVMQNCMRDYLDEVMDGTLAFWSVRRGGERVAVLAVERTRWNPIAHIREMKAKANEDASAEVWQAAARWLAGHDLTEGCTGLLAATRPAIDVRAWRAMWKPYWLDRRKCPWWVPHAPGEAWQHRLGWVRIRQ